MRDKESNSNDDSLVDYYKQVKVEPIAVENDGIVTEFVTGIPIILSSQTYLDVDILRLKEKSKNCIVVDELVPISKTEVAKILSLISGYNEARRYRNSMYTLRDYYVKELSSRLEKIEQDMYVSKNADSIINEFRKKYPLR